jgi:hypothetical protein
MTATAAPAYLGNPAQADKKAINGNFAVSGARRTSAQLFRSRRRKGR